MLRIKAILAVTWNLLKRPSKSEKTFPQLIYNLQKMDQMTMQSQMQLTQKKFGLSGKRQC